MEISIVSLARAHPLVRSNLGHLPADARRGGHSIRKVDTQIDVLDLVGERLTCSTTRAARRGRPPGTVLNAAAERKAT
jgi:hypothetical protein